MPMPPPSPALPATVRCLLAPGASVLAYAAMQSTSPWACRVGDTSDATVTVTTPSHSSRNVWSCGATAVPNDVWLGTRNDGQCSSATSPSKATSSYTKTTLRMTLYVEYSLCVVE